MRKVPRVEMASQGAKRLGGWEAGRRVHRATKMAQHQPQDLTSSMPGCDVETLLTLRLLLRIPGEIHFRERSP